MLLTYIVIIEVLTRVAFAARQTAGWRQRVTVCQALCMLRDAANRRHPMTGAGMTVAIKDAILLCDLVRPKTVPALRDTDLVLKKLAKFHWKRKYHSASLNILAHNLYLLFASPRVFLAIRGSQG